MKKSTIAVVKLLVLLILCISTAFIFSGCCMFHSYDKVVTPPTCTEGGYTTYTCVKCGEQKIKDFTEALGHDYAITTADPTCTEEGGTLHTCSRCGDSFMTDTVAALGHDYEVKTVAPTCTEDGLTVRTCSRCGDTYSEKLFDPLGHKYTEKIQVAATCKASGIITHICERCGDSYDEEYSLSVLTSEEIYDRAKESVGEVITYNKNGVALGLGSCFAIDEGVFVTNYHVIEKAYSVKITINGDSLYVNTVLAFDKDIDLAVVKAAGSGSHVPALSVCREIATGGSTVYAMGHSEGLKYSFTSGVVASPDRVVNYVHYVQHDAAISNGNSGGPLFNEYGEVIGINTWSLTSGQNLNFAISSRELDRLDYSNPMSMKDFAVTYGPYLPIEPKEMIVEETEKNDSKSTAQSITGNGATMHGKLSSSSDIDHYKITLAPGETLNIVLMAKTENETHNIFFAIVDDIGQIDSSYVSTYNGEAAETNTFKNRSSSTMTIYIGVTFRSAYTNKNKELEYWLFTYKKAGKVDKYDYVDNELGIKFKAPARWAIDEDTGYFSAEELASGDCVTIHVGDLSGLTLDEYIDLLNSTAKAMFSQSSVNVSISPLKDAKLGGAECKMEKITASANGKSIEQYLYFFSSGDSITIVQINIYSGKSLSTFESMFS